MPYKFLDTIATADAAFEAEGKNLNEVFEQCALALFSIVVDLKGVKPKKKVMIKKESGDMEKLLFEFLNELVYIKDTDNIVFSKFKVNIKQDKKQFYHLEAELKGEDINRKKHKLGHDIKAITMHMFSLEKKPEGYGAMVIVDL